ncbi:tyrosine-type recombinase/integrase [Nitrincola sp.]|uniref:tyrosine-type recombinase/integrase n=1 Tax=Nitrincola sp. TaxID=1926584 RepID=UPI003A91A61F
MWTIKLKRLENGERIYLPFQDGFPVFYPTYFITSKFRHKSPSTQSNILNHLRFLPYWEFVSNICLVDRVKSGIEMTDVEFQSLVNFTAYHKDTAEKIIQGVKVLPKAYQYVDSETRYNRLKAIQRYVCEFLYPLVSGHPDKDKQATRLNNKFNGHLPKKRRGDANIDAKLTDEQIDVLLHKILPGHPDIPWKSSDSLQLRNCLMIHTLYETGMRKGEMCGLYVEDIDIADNVIRIRKRHHDPADPRNYQPLQKTKERDIPVPEELIQALWQYITEHRGKCKAAKKHPVLFVNHEKERVGQPLSISGFDYVMKTLKAAFPILKDVYPHLFRHHFNYRFSEWLRQSPDWEKMTPKEKESLDEQTRSDVMGWQPGGQMQTLYNRRYNKEVANKAMQRRADNLSDLAKSGQKWD